MRESRRIQLHNLTGREVTITGDVGLTFWPVLGGDPPRRALKSATRWAKDGAMLSAANAAMGVDAHWRCSGGEIKSTNIEGPSPTIPA